MTSFDSQSNRTGADPSGTAAVPVGQTAADLGVDRHTVTSVDSQSYRTAGDASGTAAIPVGQAAADLGVDRHTVTSRQEEQYGGIKFGSAFFGWLTAIGMAALLTSLLAATGVALSVASDTSATEIGNQADAATGAARTIGLIGAIALLVILFVAYYCGGYVAGRMARFNGTKQGLAVWLWGLVVAIVIAVLAAVFGSKFNVLSQLNLPRIPVDEGSLTTTGIIAIVAIVIVTLVGALLGGKAGMHFHRKVDKAGLPV